jgi:hypothetical protein
MAMPNPPADAVALAKCWLSRPDVLTHCVGLKFGIRYVHFDQVSNGDDTNKPAQLHNGHVAKLSGRHCRH